MVRKSIAVTVFAFGLFASAAPCLTKAATAADNPVVVENQQPGSSAWKLTKTADDVNGQIKGYASDVRVAPGGTLTLYVTVNPAQTFTVDVFRMGWYGGMGGRLMLHDGPVNGITQSTCPTDATTGMIACNWTPSYTLSTGSAWTSGIYLAVLTNAAGYQNYVNFVVRDGRPAAFLYAEPVNTYQAFNDYPNDKLTGKSLFEYNSYGANTVAGTTRAVKVSFDRPYTGDGSGQFLSWEVQLVRWLEKSGYDVTYSTNVDTNSNGADLLNHKAFFSPGHDEFWSGAMYDAAAAARDHGVNLAFFGANAVYWQVRYEASAAGVANRVLVCYKSGSLDPVKDSTATVRFRDTPVSRPEQQLIGVQYTSEVSSGNNVPYVVTNSTNWTYASTGFTDGATVPGIVGFEMDRLMATYPAPTVSSQTLLSQSPFTNTSGASDYANSSIYQAPSGAYVFASGTTSWSWALDNYRTTIQTDPRIQQTTVNVLSAFINGPNAVHNLQVTAPATATAGQAFTVSVTALNMQGSPATSYSGTVHFASSDTSSGVVLPPDSTLTNGQGTFSATLIKAGGQTLTVSDAANNLSTTVNTSVSAAPASKLALSSATTGSPAGSPFSFAVTALDPFGNTDTAYAGTIHFTSSDTSAGVSLPADSTLTSGRGSFTATLDRAGAQTVTGTDAANSSIAGGLTVQITPLGASSINLKVPASAVVGQPFNLTVTLVDRYGNVATGYRGTLYFTSSDLVAMQLGKMPADYTFTSADAGSHTFSATLMTPPSQTIAVADTANGSLSTTSPPIAVSAL
jgi:hypothetical protein